MFSIIYDSKMFIYVFVLFAALNLLLNFVAIYFFILQYFKSSEPK